VADIVKGDSLVIVDEEHRAARSTDQFLHLILAKVPVETALLVQPMGFIDDQRVVGVREHIHERSRTAEQVADPGLLEGSSQFRFIDRTGCCVLRYVANVPATSDKGSDKVDREH